MTILKLFHVLFLFIWIGSLLSLTRFQGYLSNEEVSVQTRLAKLCRRMYLIIDMPSMIISIVLGIILFIYTPLKSPLGWFHMKLTFTVGLIICDIICGRMIHKIYKFGFTNARIKYKILHSITALMLIGVLTSIYIVRNKESELRNRIMSEQKAQRISHEES